MGIYIKSVLLLGICLILAGCGDPFSISDSPSGRMHYSDLLIQRGEPREMISDGAGGRIYSYSPLPIEDALEDASRGLGSSDIYYIDRQGYVYR